MNEVPVTGRSEGRIFRPRPAPTRREVQRLALRSDPAKIRVDLFRLWLACRTTPLLVSNHRKSPLPPWGEGKGVLSRLPPFVLSVSKDERKASRPTRGLGSLSEGEKALVSAKLQPGNETIF